MYKIKSLKVQDTRDGYKFDCQIVKGGEVVGTAKNAGRGGATKFKFEKEEEWEAFKSYAERRLLKVDGLDCDAELYTEELINDYEEMLISTAGGGA